MKSLHPRKANILTENVIFIVLNLIFLTILFLFVSSKSQNAAQLEEKYAKQIALILDSAKPVMTIRLNIEDALKEKDNDFNSDKIVTINGNTITFKLREKGGYSYDFFNDIEVNSWFDKDVSEYVFIVNGYKGEQNEN